MRRLAVVPMLALAVVLGACGSSDRVTNPVVQSTMAGTWNLQTINGYGLPYTVVQIGADNFQIVGDVIAADTSGTFTEVMTVESDMNGQVFTDTIPDAGTWAVSDNAVSLSFSSSSSTVIGQILGNTLSLPIGGSGVMTYARQ